MGEIKTELRGGVLFDSAEDTG